MQKPSSDEYAISYQKYFDLVLEGEYLSLLRQNSIDTINLLKTFRAKNLTINMRKENGQ